MQNFVSGVLPLVRVGRDAVGRLCGHAVEFDGDGLGPKTDQFDGASIAISIDEGVAVAVEKGVPRDLLAEAGCGGPVVRLIVEKGVGRVLTCR